MTRHLPFPHLYFNSARRSPAEQPAAAAPQVLRAAVAGDQSEHRPSVGEAGRPAAASPTTDVAVGCQYRFGSGPSIHQPGSTGQGRARDRVTCSAAAKFNLRRLCAASSRSPDAARASLKLGQFAQTLLDIVAVGFLLAFFFLLGASIVGAVGFMLLFVAF